MEVRTKNVGNENGEKKRLAQMVFFSIFSSLNPSANTERYNIIDFQICPQL